MFKPWLIPDLETKPRTYTPDLDGVIAWLSEQDGAAEYPFIDPDDCLFARFSYANFGDRSLVLKIGTKAFADRLKIANPLPWTYSAALTRAINLRNGGK